MEYSQHPDLVALVKSSLGDILKENPELIEGYLVVGWRIDDMIVVGHNSCCLPHLINRIHQAIAENPSLCQPSPVFREDHDS